MSYFNKKMLLMAGIILAMITVSIPLVVSDMSVDGENEIIEVTTGGGLNLALLNSNVDIVVTNDITLRGDNEIKTGTKLTVQSGATLTLNGTLINNGTLDLVGDMVVNTPDSWSPYGPYNNGINVLTVGDDGKVYAGVDGGVLIYAEGAWEMFGTGIENFSIYSLVMGDNNTLYASSGIPREKGVFKYENGIWTMLEGSEDKVATALILDNAGSLYVGIDNGKIFKYNSGTWTDLSKGLSSKTIRTFEIDSLGNIYAGISEGGIFKLNVDTWETYGTNAPGTTVYSLATDSNNNLYASFAVGVGVYKCVGNEWTNIGKPPGTQSIRSIVIENDVLYVTADAAGILTYSGNSLTKVEGCPDGFYYTITVDNEGNLYAGGSEAMCKYDGNYWERIDTNLGYSSFNDFTIAGNGDMYLGGEYGSFKYAQGLWSNLNVDSVYAMEVDGNNNLYASINGVAHIYQNGSWNPIGHLEGKPVETFALDNAGSLFVGTTHGVFKLVGNDWERFGTNLDYITVEVLATDSENNLYAGTYDNGVFKCINGSWTPFGSTLNDPYISTIAIDSGNNVYIGNEDGVFKCIDNTWTNILTFQDTFVTVLAIDGKDDLYVGTTSEGVFKYVNGSWISFNTGITNFDINRFALNSRGELFIHTDNGVFGRSSGILDTGSLEKIAFNGGSISFSGNGTFSVNGVTKVGVNGEISVSQGSVTITKTSDDKRTISLSDDEGTIATINGNTMVNDSNITIGNKSILSLEANTSLTTNKITIADGGRLNTSSSSVVTKYLTDSSIATNKGIDGNAKSVVVLKEYVGLKKDAGEVVFKVLIHLDGGSIQDNSWTKENDNLYSSLIRPIDITGARPELPTPGKNGYEFKEWKQLLESDGATILHEYEAQYVQLLTITIDTSGGSFEDPSWTHSSDWKYTKVFNKDSELTLPTLVKDHHDHVGWTPDLETPVTSEKEYTASWEIHTYEITLDASGGTVSDRSWIDRDNGKYAQTFSHGSELSLPTPARDHYDFIGWTPDLETPVTSEKEYTANWEIHTYVITIDPNGGVVSDQLWAEQRDGTYTRTFEHGSALELPAITRDNYNFKEWSPAPTDIVTAIAEYEAQWEMRSFNVTLDTKGGSISDPTWTSNGNGVYTKTFTYGSILTLPTAAKQYHEFDKWSPSPSSTVTRNAEYEASWSTVTFKVTLDTKGGSISDPFWLPAGNGKYVRYVEAGSSVVLPTASKDGTSFQGWTASSSSITVVSDLYLTAQWGSGTTTTFDPIIVYVIIAIAIIGMAIIAVVSIGKGR